ncbi:S8 family serine peptidase [Larkinella soli]|uniref:S8 family serine peptidase n=1 Tax=Larkinella soli TaxID=1770527 RepID=UPI000FFB9C65|nr:S8 family serine peptidase [Larkinella soli]
MADISFFESARTRLRDQAYANFVAHRSEIERVGYGIQQNRSGQLPLSHITNDIDRLSKRIAREGMQVEKALERINNVPNFQDVSVIRKILRNSSSVCRIVIQTSFGNSGYGTGFLISPQVLLTNHHVLPDVETALRSEAQFGYELDENGHIQSPISFRLRPDRFFLTSPYETHPEVPYSGRDFTMVAVEPTGTEGASLDQFGYIRMDSSLGKIIEGENCVVIQHPKGDYKKLVLRDIRLITLTENFLIYESDTLPGSSGSAVLGLGTGVIVALHHSSIPRKDAAGNWLRKDGSPVQPDDPDELIDWIGNEGVRVSCIVEAFNKLPVPDAMQPYRRQIIEAQTSSLPTMNAPISHTAPIPPAALPAESTLTAHTGTESTAGLQYFEVVLTSQPTLLDDWEQKAALLVEGLVEDHPLIPHSFDPYIRRMRYVSVRTARNPWEQAAFMESLPHIESCKPDLEMLTDIGLTDSDAPTRQGPQESELIYNEGTAAWNEEKFLKDFGQAGWVQKAKKVRADYYRWWNWLAVNCPADGNRTGKDWDAIRQNLASLRFVQLDTGYSSHSKVFSGVDTDKDFDFIDSDADARDLMDRLLLKHPGHGTRTGSLAVGGTLAADPRRLDGNGGLLNFGGQVPARLIPYRISKSVILLGRGKQLVDAAGYAIRSQADVMFMCMGTYPRAMFAAIAREAYENGVIWVCAAGNEVEVVVAPAVYPGTIAVAAVNPADQPWKGSSNGPMVDIAAPGESVYVPFIDKQGNEIMVYGDGTSYATPHVASAAMLWKARHLDALSQYDFPWQIVEAFRFCLKQSARTPDGWRTDRYGAGILDVEKLLTLPLPKKAELKHAYAASDPEPSKDLGVVEAVHFVWNILRRKAKRGPTESFPASFSLTPRGQLALQAFTAGTQARAYEAAGFGDQIGQEALLREYFNQ